MFPLQYRIREMRVLLLMMLQGVPPGIALHEADALLSDGPNPNVLLQKAFLEIRSGMKDEAKKTLAEYEKIAPEGNDSQFVYKLLESMKAKANGG